LDLSIDRDGEFVLDRSDIEHAVSATEAVMIARPA
jgi:hypothetical protein